MRMTLLLLPEALQGIAPFLGAGGPECFESLFAGDVSRATGMLPSRVRVLSLRHKGGDTDIERQLVQFELMEARLGEIPLLDDCVKALIQQARDPKSALLAGRVTGKLDVGFTPIRATVGEYVYCRTGFGYSSALPIRDTVDNEDEKATQLRQAALKPKAQLEIRNTENAALKAKLARLQAPVAPPP